MKLKLILTLITLKLSNCFITRSKPKCLGGVELGITTFGTGLLMDQIISKESKLTLKKKQPQLYVNGIKNSFQNLILVGPLYYQLVDHLFLNNVFHYHFLVETSLITLIHSVGYYCAHKSMHRSNQFRDFHSFHHQFNETLIPTIGNSVSIQEFTIAYMLPFVIGAALINPHRDSFNMAIAIVSFMNLVIHTPELSTISWSKWFVSPYTHLRHHQGTNIQKSYSAPTINLEYIYEQIQKVIKDLVQL